MPRTFAASSYPNVIRVDQGAEFVSRDLDLWAYSRGVTLDFSRPGKPTDNAFIKAFNGRLRAECLRTYGASAPTRPLCASACWVHIRGMEEPLILKALRDKRAEIHGKIAAYQGQIAQAKHDLVHLNATIRMFTDLEYQRARYVVSHGFFKKGEIVDLCVLHLQQDRTLTTRELAERVMCERGLDATDLTLRNSVVFKVVQALRHAARRRMVVMVDKQKGMCIWSVGPAISLRVANIPSKNG